MRGHFKKTRFDLYLRESRSRRPKFRSGSKGHLGGSYGPYKLQIPQLTKKRAMIFKIVDDGRLKRIHPIHCDIKSNYICRYGQADQLWLSQYVVVHKVTTVCLL